MRGLTLLSHTRARDHRNAHRSRRIAAAFETRADLRGPPRVASRLRYFIAASVAWPNRAPRDALPVRRTTSQPLRSRRMRGKRPRRRRLGRVAWACVTIKKTNHDRELGAWASGGRAAALGVAGKPSAHALAREPPFFSARFGPRIRVVSAQTVRAPRFGRTAWRARANAASSSCRQSQKCGPKKRRTGTLWLKSCQTIP